MNTRLINICALAVSVMLTSAWKAVAEVPKLVNYQGRLTTATGEPLTSGTYQVRFELFDTPDPSQPGGTPLIWGATYTNVVVVSGQFNVVLGATGGTPVPGAAVNNIGFAFTGPDRYLQLTVLTNNSGTNILSPQVLLPRQQILSVPYALNVADGAVTAPKLAPDVLEFQWSKTDSGISYNHGRVGIGTSTPGAKLDVTGGGIGSSEDSDVGGYLTLHNPRKTGRAASSWTLYNMTDSYRDSFQIYSYPADGQNPCCIRRFEIDDDGTTALVPSGGNVGVGTRSPVAKLDVVGDLRGDFFQANANAGGLRGQYGFNNSVVAWGRMQAGGTINSSQSYGVVVAQSVRTGEGIYQITIATSMASVNTLVPCVTPITISSGPRMVTVQPVAANRFNVRIWEFFGTGAALTDTDFYFTVTGR